MQGDNTELKQELLERFRTYLNTEFPCESTADEIDQMSLFREMAGLRNEVKIESRQFKGALDDFRQAFTSLDDQQQEIVRIMQAKSQHKHQAKNGIPAPAIFGLIELYDKIAAGLATELPKPSLAERLLPGGKRGRQLLRGHLEGQEIILGRVLDLLEQCGVSTIEAVGKRFNPNIMKAVGFEVDPRQQGNTVLEENNKGFRQGEKIVRAPEVIVNKREE